MTGNIFILFEKRSQKSKIDATGEEKKKALNSPLIFKAFVFLFKITFSLRGFFKFKFQNLGPLSLNFRFRKYSILCTQFRILRKNWN